MDAELEAYSELDTRLVDVGSRIKLLSSLAWPASVGEEFLRNWDAGTPALPNVELPKLDFSEAISALNKIIDGCDKQHPVGAYLRRTASSYITAATMLENLQSPIFTELSTVLYGKPGDAIAPNGPSNLDAAHHFIHNTDHFVGTCFLPEESYSVTPQYVASQLSELIKNTFPGHSIDVIVDPNLSAKAVAGGRRVRIRGATSFSEMDVGQLAQHEVLVHTLTAINGREQPHLKSMGLGAPRTTATQEGLATIAELITSSIDLSRLRRIALRINAVQMALEGANFIEVFRFFLEAGQNAKESFSSTMRVFRGGNVNGNIVFTKDVVYLQGLLWVHTFLLKSIEFGKPDFSHRLFAGRMTLSDLVALEPFFDSGYIKPPLYEPKWVANRHTLAAYLVYSLFDNRIALGDIKINDFLEGDAPEIKRAK